MTPSFSPGSRAVALLAGLGRLLDAMDLGRLPMNPSQFQRAAALARGILKTSAASPDVQDALALSPALQCLAANLQLDIGFQGHPPERAATGSRVKAVKGWFPATPP